MKRTFDEILATFPIEHRDVSWLEALVPISNGYLLAKILYKLEEPDLKMVRQVSKTLNDVCKRYQLLERFYTGKAYMFGTGPQMVRHLPSVKVVSCGEMHTGFVTTMGEVYMCGFGALGRLGNGCADDHFQSIPTRVLNISKAASVACGDVHTMIMAVDGDVYTFGLGYGGVLGDGNIETHVQAVPLRIPDLPKAKSIACNVFNSGFVSENGELYMCGSGYSGRLGDANADHHYAGLFQIVPGIPPVKQLSCGYGYSGVVTVEGDVYMFGLSLGNGDNVTTPRKVKNLPEIQSISCGSYDTGLVTKDGLLIMFGKSTDRAVRHIQNVPRIKALSCGHRQTMVVSVENDAYISKTPTSGFTKIDNLPAAHKVSCNLSPCASMAILTMPERSLNLTI